MNAVIPCNRRDRDGGTIVASQAFEPNSQKAPETDNRRVAYVARCVWAAATKRTRAKKATSRIAIGQEPTVHHRQSIAQPLKTYFDSLTADNRAHQSANQTWQRPDLTISDRSPVESEEIRQPKIIDSSRGARHTVRSVAPPSLPRYGAIISSF